MCTSLNFPNKYYIVWLDQQIGNPDFCKQLKRTFFTHFDPELDTGVPFSAQDVDLLIQNQEEVPVTFDSFHCTLKPFIDQTTCLNYFEQVQNDRVLFITSSAMGKSAVKKLLEQYPHTFTNRITNDPYDSIYIFCGDIEKACEWAGDYYEYVKVFNFEADLLARMTRDIAEELLGQGQQLLEANQNQEAIDRLSWARSLYIRHDNLKFDSVPEAKPQSTDENTRTNQTGSSYTQSSLPKVSRPNKYLRKIDELISIAEKRMKEPDEDDSNQTDNLASTISTQTIPPVTDHVIVWLNQSTNSSEQVENEKEYKPDVSDSIELEKDKSVGVSGKEFEHQMKTCLSNFSGTLETFHDVDYCQEYIINNGTSKTIFLILMGTVGEKILQSLSNNCKLINKIYIIDDYTPNTVQWMSHYRQEGVRIVLFDESKDALIRMLKDISQYYLLKGQDHKRSKSLSTNSSLVYFDWSKQLITCANELELNEFQSQLNHIEKCESETKQLIKEGQLDNDIEKKIRSFLVDEDADSVVIVFIIELEMRLIHLDSGFARLLTSNTNDEIVSAINNIQFSTPVIIVSPTLPTDNVLSLKQLLNYYCFSKSKQNLQSSTIPPSNITYISSIDQLMTQLYHQLSQYYRNSAIRATMETKDHQKAKRLLEKSTQCYKLLQDDTNQILKRYAQMLNKDKT